MKIRMFRFGTAICVRTTLAALALICSTFDASAQTDPAICDTTQQLITHAQRGFSQIKGPTIAGTAISRQTDIRFPGAARCEITELAARTEYACDWAPSSDNPKLIAELGRNIATCLPEGKVEITDAETPRPRHIIKTRNAEFYLSVDSIDGNVYLTVRAL